MIESVALNMVVFNEGHRIYDTLTAIEHIVDEVVIVDQSSLDNTVEEIRRWEGHARRAALKPLRVKIITDKHHGYCEPSRKLAHQYTESEWILVLDADETVSHEFMEEMRSLNERGFGGARLLRSLYIAGEHRWTGDYQYRFFHRNAVHFLDELHTEPQCHISESHVYSTPYVGILHRKSWQEQIRDDMAYEELVVNDKSSRGEAKRALNVHLALLREKGITAEQADAMTLQERINAGISLPSETL